jgi:Ca2+-binding EF-hand superfamily protein
MNKKNISKLHDIFSVLDRNADGVLSNSVICFENAIRILYYSNMYKYCIDQELSMGLSRMNVKYSDFLGKIFHEIDTDGNGTIGKNGLHI